MQGRTRLLHVGVDSTTVPRIRVGFQPQPEAREWADDLAAEIQACAGIAPPLFRASSEGSAAREAFRRFTAAVVEHLGEIVAAEASMKLELPVALSFERLRGADVQARARASATLVDKAGLSADEALRLVGLD